MNRVITKISFIRLFISFRIMLRTKMLIVKLMKRRMVAMMMKTMTKITKKVKMKKVIMNKTV